MKLLRDARRGGLILRPRYFKLATLYFVLCATLGVFLAYWPLYLQSIDFNSAEIGGLVAAGLISRTISPYVFGWWTDHSGRIARIMTLASLFGALFFALSLFEFSYPYMVVVIFLFSFFWGSLLPQIDTLALMNLGKSPEYYSLLRLWGSVGFIVSVICVAPVLDVYGVSSVPWTILALCLLMSALIPGVKGRRFETGVPAAPIHTKLARPEIILLLVVCLLVQLSHGPYYAFFSIYAKTHGYGNFEVGTLWSLAVVAEVVILVFSGRILLKTGALSLLTWSIVLTIVRWLLTALFPAHMPTLIVAQTLHAVSFGTYHVAAVDLICRWFPGRLQARGQALYASVSFGLGGALGSYITGQLWDDLGGGVFLLSAAVAAVAVALCLCIGRFMPANP